MVRALAEHGDPEIETLLFMGPDSADDRLVRELIGLPRTRIIVDQAFVEDRVRGGIGRTLRTGRNAPILDAFAREHVSVAFTPAIYLGWRSEVPTIAWFPSGSLSCVNCETPVATPSSATYYTIIVTDDAGCGGRRTRCGVAGQGNT